MPAHAPLDRSRALVPLTRTERRSAQRLPEAAFLAHLIATRQQAPQTRERRRAEPQQAAALYRSRQPMPARRPTLSRAL